MRAAHLQDSELLMRHVRAHLSHAVQCDGEARKAKDRVLQVMWRELAEAQVACATNKLSIVVHQHSEAI
jgi:hypothetical protein